MEWSDLALMVKKVFLFPRGKKENFNKYSLHLKINPRFEFIFCLKLNSRFG